MLPVIQAVIAEAQEVSVGKSRIKIMEADTQVQWSDEKGVVHTESSIKSP